MLEPFGEFYTGGLSAGVLGGEIFAYNLIPIGDGLLAVTNPGSNSISIFIVNDDFTLTLAATAGTSGELPFTMTEANGFLYVADYDVSENFDRQTSTVYPPLCIRTAADALLTPLFSRVCFCTLRSADKIYSTAGRRSPRSASTMKQGNWAVWQTM